jgi:3-hydroxyisobutyrate dehydrogenase-like beta-hydroxyacid dehydrogenase
LTSVTLLHPGAMGAPVGGELTRAGVRVLWVGAGRSAATAARARAAGLIDGGSLPAALGESEVVLSICPPAAAEAVAQAVATARFTGTYVEANAIAPQRTRRIAATLERATVVDGGLIGPPPTASGTTRLYLSGAGAGPIAALCADTTLEVVVLDGDVGAASALKLAYAGYQKTSRILAALSHGLAREHGVQDALEHEAALLHSRPLADTAALGSAAAKAWRWAPELREVADAMRTAGLPAELAAGAAAALERWEPAKDREDLELDALLALLVRPPAGSGPG